MRSVRADDPTFGAQIAVEPVNEWCWWLKLRWGLNATWEVTLAGMRNAI